jgi:hypothetical protein
MFYRVNKGADLEIFGHKCYTRNASVIAPLSRLLQSSSPQSSNCELLLRTTPILAHHQ